MTDRAIARAARPKDAPVSTTAAQLGLLVEAEAFDDYGGWTLDS